MAEETESGSVKKFLYVNRKAPYGTIYALESLEVVLIGAAFEQDVSLAFLGDGVYQLVKGEDTKALEVKNFSPTYRALEDYDVTKIYVDDEALKARGLRVGMITGDSARTAQAIARQAGLDDVTAEVLPSGKAEAVQRLQAAGRRVAFVGDGINDAPALAQAEVGVAVATGTDIAIEAADVTLTRGDLGGLLNALEVARRTMRTIRANLFWAFIYNILLIPLAAGAFYPAWGLTLNPMLAGLAMGLSSVFVLTNSLRLRRVRPVDGPPTDGAARGAHAARGAAPAPAAH